MLFLYMKNVIFIYKTLFPDTNNIFPPVSSGEPSGGRSGGGDKTLLFCLLNLVIKMNVSLPGALGGLRGVRSVCDNYSAN